MSYNLKVFLILMLLFGIILIIRRLKSEKISIRYAVFWIFLLLLLILSVLCSNIYFELSKFLGFETTSNMVFVFGFFFLLYIIFILLINISKLNDKVKTLVQEVSILKERVEKNEKEGK